MGCLVQGIDPFDDDNLAVWGDRGACDSSTVGCEVRAINHPSASYQGALWASTSGSDGSSSCTCDICDPYPWSVTTSYMSEETSLWSRIVCYLAASEASGYDVSPCVAAILDTGTLPCVDDLYEPPAVDQFDCEENAIKDLSDSSSHEECTWDGDPHRAQELFSATSSSPSMASTSVVVNTSTCLVGCLVQGISPFDENNLAVWDNRGTCDITTIGCEVAAIKYPSTTYQGALWASSWGTEGSSSCTCSICDPYPWSDTTSYMEEETSLWSRIHCYLAASEASGYDVSPCVAAIVDTGTLPCVDELYEPPTVGQFECEENGIRDLTTSESYESCNWDGDVRMAQEMFSSTSASSSTTGTNVGVSTNACLVGCLLQDISPFDEDGLAVWDNRATCDSTTIGCEVTAINYPSTTYQGALWASSWGSDGSTNCACSICDPYPWSVTTDYMSEDKSLWSRIHCYLVASEESGYDVSPCVAAIMDTGTLPCVDDVYEPPTVGQFDCDENGIKDLTTSESYEECAWAGEARSTDEFYGGTRAPSPLPSPTTAPIPSNTRDVTPQPAVTSTDSPDTTPAAPSSMPSAKGPQPSTAATVSPDTTPVGPSSTPSPLESGPTPQIEVEGVSCAVGSTCQDNLCCHPDTNTCGRSELPPAMTHRGSIHG